MLKEEYKQRIELTQSGLASRSIDAQLFVKTINTYGIGAYIHAYARAHAHACYSKKKTTNTIEKIKRLIVQIGTFQVCKGIYFSE